MMDIEQLSDKELDAMHFKIRAHSCQVPRETIEEGPLIENALLG